MRFYPQGVNWVQLAESKAKWPPNISFNETYFGKHQEEIQSSLREMNKFGYNVVRVRVDGDSISGAADKLTLNSSYVENLIAFIRMANSYRIYVLITGQWLPKNYYAIPYNERYIWGVTAGILRNLYDRIYR